MPTLRNSCIVDQNIDVPVSLLHVAHRFRDLRWLREITNDRLDADELRRQPIETRPVYVQCDEPGTLRMKAARDCLPDSIRGAGHQYDSIREPRRAVYHFAPVCEDLPVCRAVVISMPRLAAE